MRPLDGSTEPGITSDGVRPAISILGSTSKGYESWRSKYCHRDDYSDDQSIKNKTATSKATAIKQVIEIVIGYRECIHDQVGVDHDKQLGTV